MRRLALLNPIMRRPCADREERSEDPRERQIRKQETHQEQLDLNDPIREGSKSLDHVYKIVSGLRNPPVAFDYLVL